MPDPHFYVAHPGRPVAVPKPVAEVAWISDDGAPVPRAKRDYHVLHPAPRSVRAHGRDFAGSDARKQLAVACQIGCSSWVTENIVR